MALANQYIANALNVLFGEATVTGTYTAHHYALMSTMPTAGGGGVECSGGPGPYARQNLTNNNTNYPAASVGATSKFAATAVAFTGLPVGTWVGIAIYSEGTGGTLLGFGEFATPITTASNDSITLPASSGIQISYTAE